MVVGPSVGAGVPRTSKSIKNLKLSRGKLVGFRVTTSETHTHTHTNDVDEPHSFKVTSFYLRGMPQGRPMKL
jgi:hypothetical protein